MPEYKIVFTSIYNPESMKVIKGLVPPGFQLAYPETDSWEELEELIKDADFFIARGFRGVTAEMIKAAPKLKFIQKWGVGVDRCDLEALRRAGIPLANTAGGNAVPCAEHTLALMLAVARQIIVADRTTRAGRYLKYELHANSVQIHEKVIGIVGMGNIAWKVVEQVQGFKPKEVIYHSRHRHVDAERELGVKYRPLDEVLREADFVSLHVPLTDQTRNLIGRRELAMMKPRAILINISRGAIVDEQALYEALRDRQILGAGLDAFAHEPTDASNPLFGLDNVVVTPHQAGYTIDSVETVARHCFRNIVLFAEGKALPEEDVIVPPR